MASAPMDDKKTGNGDMDRIVYAYLKRRGFKDATEALEKEAPSISINQIVSSLPTVETGVSVQVSAIINGEDYKLEDVYLAYKNLTSWIGTSLDQYRNELYSVTYPLFVHTYIDMVIRASKQESSLHGPSLAIQFMREHGHEHLEFHRQEIEALKAVTLPEHVMKSEIVDIFRKGKYRLQLCNYSFELLMGYLQERKYMALISTINQHIQIDVLSGKPRRSRQVEGLRGLPDSSAESFNKKSVKWGTLPLLDEEEEDDEEDDPAAAGANGTTAAPSAADAEEARARRRAKKKPRVIVPDAPERTRIPLPPVKGRDYEMRLKAMEEIQKQVALSATALPSACMYTLFNARDSCTSLAFSDDATMMSGGFSDSAIRVWDLTGKGLRAAKSTEQLDQDFRTWEEILEETSHPSKTLIGHSGPVYAVRFSPDNLYLLSASEDSTLRLWSLITFSAVVCYKGHNFPVWDCAFSPLGYYFASASSDRTARIWTTEHIHPVRILAGHLSDVDSVEFHPNGNYVATGSADRTVRLWDVQTGECVRLFQGHVGVVYSLAFSPDGRLLASSGEDGIVILWDIAGGKRCKSLHGHTNVVHNLSFCGGSTLLASGGLDNRIRIWDVVAASRADLVNLVADDDDDDKDRESTELLKSYYSKMTPITALRFARVNVLLAAGVFASES